ncbi:MAG: OmpH family outer membrane protein [Vulcanimicrobiota bacterium]
MSNQLKKQNLLRGGLLSVMLALVALGLTGCPGATKAPVDKVVSLDEQAIYDLPAFKKAEEDLKKWVEDERKKLEKKAEGKNDEERNQLAAQFQVDVQKKTNETLQPLKVKAEAAVAKVARDQGALVVLDKKIVVYGVKEVTEDVTKLLESGEEIKLPEEQDTQGAPIGYFDQAVVRSLKVFQEADLELAQYRNQLLMDLKKELNGKEPSPSEAQAIQRNLSLKLEAFQEQKMAPLIKAVNDSVKEVAETQGLSLVLDKQHVMYGGKNMTEEVVDAFLKKVAQPAGGETPAGEATPKGGE